MLQRMIDTTGEERQQLRDKVMELNQRVSSMESVTAVAKNLPPLTASSTAAEEPSKGTGVTEEGVPYEYLFDQTGIHSPRTESPHPT